MYTSSYSDSLPLTKSKILSGDVKSRRKIHDILDNRYVYSIKIVYENPELANCILERNLQNTFDEYGYTPLMICVKCDCINAIDELLKQRVDPNFHTPGEQTALLLATYKYVDHPNDINEGIVHSLLCHGADPHIKNSSGDSPYSLLKEAGKLGTFKLE